MEIAELVIIGAGPGGVAAAVQAKRLGVKPLLIDQIGDAGGLARHAYSIENYPGIPPTAGSKFAQMLRDHLRRFEVAVEKDELLDIRRDKNRFSLTCRGRTLYARAAILAVGTGPKRPEIVGEQLLRYTPDVSQENTVRQIVVLGGGEAALDYALSLASAGSQVTVLCRGSKLKARGRLVALVRDNPNIEIRFETQVTGIYQNERRFELSLTYGGKTQITGWADLVVAAIGRESNVEKLLGGLDEGHHMTVSTRIPGLYLVGDARLGTLGQAGMAVGDGLAAAMAAVTLLREKRSG